MGYNYKEMERLSEEEKALFDKVTEGSQQLRHNLLLYLKIMEAADRIYAPDRLRPGDDPRVKGPGWDPEKPGTAPWGGLYAQHNAILAGEKPIGSIILGGMHDENDRHYRAWMHGSAMGVHLQVPFRSYVDECPARPANGHKVTGLYIDENLLPRRAEMSYVGDDRPTEEDRPVWRDVADWKGFDQRANFLRGMCDPIYGFDAARLGFDVSAKTLVHCGPAPDFNPLGVGAVEQEEPALYANRAERRKQLKIKSKKK